MSSKETDVMSSSAFRDIPFGRPMLGEEETRAVLDALSSPQLVHGPQAAAFEQQFAMILGPNAYATSVSSCTAGLHLIYLHLGIGPGDEVIVPAQTHVATAHAVEITGARPVFVDCDPSGNINPDLIAGKVTDRTRAICVVHFPGLPVDVKAVEAIARPRGIFIVEDCALAVGATFDGVSCGLLGDAASFSFYPAKHMTTGEGGMVVSRDPDVIESIANIKAFGYDRSPQARTVPGVYDIARLGLNYRMNEISAAIGIEQMRKLPGFLARRAENAAHLRSALSGTDKLTLLPAGDERRSHANYCLVGVLSPQVADQRDTILTRLKARGVGLSVHYPVPLPLSGYYRDRYGAQEQEFPEARQISEGSLAIPVGPHLDDDDLEFLVESLLEALHGVTP